ncbi:3-methyl-2-oxobutanoate hydroxymethyltransferase [Candidatus Aminicenantes bacterium AC-335-B20]|jgi:3-methyl-2-oxobutanoate hydroxymethyltransferase|nr:3-methyl-2-oxobutanoate hydroxymethyltransferase [SCandidatus Aminicenantes bacterium Aminicenantia_JdfR_composite]MCP2596271.1 3-methyl-2-oxobutanoate hydroxymethyltransferase [Candidatus Aminicenantes bacterium AC-335-G13]MCP2597846.1 3-methyl-2-oxobutanoate hydroxymethyltransferase [Candidatus Aminicenantes bacterium AC-335-L06]MCP2599060.1 3-methyl-2-oxobutanoate hydroxymethyltransferase [Candidatus Aminicenantes bacterium AC-335-B20]MCP2605616.1 3-methyl-2-oxobutanoate hydroxymethyltran
MEEKICKVTIPSLLKKKENREKIVAITSYDYPITKIVEEAGIDLILVGDSLGMVVLGYDNTLPVSMDEMIHHTKAVVRARKKAVIVGDMPFLSYHLSIEQGLENAFRFIKEAGADAIKIEGASPKRLELIRALREAEIPVMGHIGLTPQSILNFGEFKVQGKSREKAKKLIEEALALEQAGVFSIILECIPMELSKIITEKVKVPTIGIGAGPYCDGQILVFHDLVGYLNGYLPKFVKKYADLHNVILNAVEEYIREVKNGKFPLDKHSYHMKPDVLEELEKNFKTEKDS